METDFVSDLILYYLFFIVIMYKSVFMKMCNDNEKPAFNKIPNN